MARETKRELDPRDQPIYSIPGAAWYLALPPSTVRFWTVGAAYRTPKGNSRQALPLIAAADRDPPALSFWNLVEVYVLDGIRRHHKVSLQKVRKALSYVEREMGVDRPLINQEFVTDGVFLFVEHYTQLINVTGQGQLALRELLKGSLRRIDRDPRGLASKLSPWLRTPDEPREVEIDPLRSFGKRILSGTGVPTEVLGERFRAGDSIGDLARDYRLSPEQVEAALRWEQCAAVQ